MLHRNRDHRFQEHGPEIDNESVLAKHGSLFIFNSHRIPWAQKSTVVSLQKIVTALNREDFADAAIRFSHIENDLLFAHSQNRLARANFNPTEPRDNHGRWTKDDESSEIAEEDDYPSPAFCRLVKELCIVEATDAFPTRDYGFAFHKAYNSCMDRHGRLGRA